MGLTQSRPWEASLSELIQKHEVLVVSSTRCSYCSVVKRSLESLGTKFESLELNQLEPEEGQKLFDETAAITKQRTVPQVFICGKWIGGCEETRRMLASGDLQKLILDCCQGDITCRDRG